MWRRIEKPSESQQSVHLYIVNAKEKHHSIAPDRCLSTATFTILQPGSNAVSIY